MADEAFHEIQLNGKQLVFLFMAATVVAVVIFLCGVMVGRGVRPQRAAETADASLEGPRDPTADIHDTPRIEDAAPPTASPAAGPAGAEELTYPERLADPTASPETLTANAERRTANPEPRTANPERGTENANPERRTPNPERGTRNSELRVPSGDGFTVQVAAVKQRGEADTIAQRLAKKGYAAYVMPPAAGAPPVFRVRVGKFKDRREAESIAGRLQKEEQFRPWVTK